MRTLTGAESKVRSGGNQARARNKTYFDAVEEEFFDATLAYANGAQSASYESPLW